MCAICDHGRMEGSGIARHIRTDGPPLMVLTGTGWVPAVPDPPADDRKAAEDFWGGFEDIIITVKVDHNGTS
jgi:hypothetical protein